MQVVYLLDYTKLKTAEEGTVLQAGRGRGGAGGAPPAHHCAPPVHHCGRGLGGDETRGDKRAGRGRAGRGGAGKEGGELVPKGRAGRRGAVLPLATASARRAAWQGPCCQHATGHLAGLAPRHPEGWWPCL